MTLPTRVADKAGVLGSIVSAMSCALCFPALASGVYWQSFIVVNAAVYEARRLLSPVDLVGRKVHRNGITPPKKPTGGPAWAASRWLLPPWLAAAVTLSAFGLYLLFLSYSYMIDYDFYVWVEGAKTLRQEGIWAVGKVYKEPLLSLLLNLVAPIFGGNYEGAGKAISLLSGSIAIGLVFLLAYELFGSRLLALLAALLVAVHPQMIYYSTHPFSEALYLCLIMLAMLCFWRAHQGGSLPVAVEIGRASCR